MEKEVVNLNLKGFKPVEKKNLEDALFLIMDSLLCYEDSLSTHELMADNARKADLKIRTLLLQNAAAYKESNIIRCIERIKKAIEPLCG